LQSASGFGIFVSDPGTTRRLMKKIVAVAMILVGALTLTGCGEEPTSVPDVVGLRLDKAKDALDGVWVREVDYLGEDRVIRDKNWTVCTQSVAPGDMASSIVLEVAKDVSDCPDQRTPEQRAADAIEAEKQAEAEAEAEEYYASLEDSITANTAVLKPGEWATLEMCEVRLLDDPAVNTFDTYGDEMFLLDSWWRIKEMGDYLYVFFESKPGCGFFDSTAVTLEKGYEPYWEKHNSYAWHNSWEREDGFGASVVVYKIKDGVTKFKLGLNHGAGPFYEFSAR